MAVKQIPKETQQNVGIGVIEQFFFDPMSKFHGKEDLSWIACLFAELKNALKVEKGMVHCHRYGINEVQSHLERCGIYGQFGRPHAQLYTQELPKGFDLFMTGPECNDKNLRIMCSSPKLDLRDFEESSVVNEIASEIEELVKAKHENVEAELYKKESRLKPGVDRVVLYKTWKMPVELPFLFEKDVRDI